MLVPRYPHFAQALPARSSGQGQPGKFADPLGKSAIQSRHAQSLETPQSGILQ